MKKDRTQALFLEHLKKIPIVQVAVEKAGIARSTVYKWRDEDPAFRADMEAAIKEGEAMLNDLGENQLYALMLERHWPSIQFWLKHRNPKFKEKLEIAGTFTHTRKLTDEQKDNIRMALRRGKLSNLNTDSHD